LLPINVCAIFDKRVTRILIQQTKNTIYLCVFLYGICTVLIALLELLVNGMQRQDQGMIGQTEERHPGAAVSADPGTQTPPTIQVKSCPEGKNKIQEESYLGD
jgi:hypothetical protein